MNLLGKTILNVLDLYQNTPNYPWLQKMSQVLQTIRCEAIFHLGHPHVYTRFQLYILATKVWSLLQAGKICYEHFVIFITL